LPVSIWSGPSAFTPTTRQSSKPYLRLKLLTQSGVEEQTVFKREKTHYQFAKKLHWGDLILAEDDLKSSVSST